MSENLDLFSQSAELERIEGSAAPEAIVEELKQLKKDITYHNQGNQYQQNMFQRIFAG